MIEPSPTSIWPYKYRDFNEFKKEKLDGKPYFIGISNAEDEIALYYDRKAGSSITPEMVLDDEIKKNHQQLESWFTEMFFSDILNDKHAAAGNDDQGWLIEEFGKFRWKIYSLMKQRKIPPESINVAIKKMLVDIYFDMIADDRGSHDGVMDDIYYPYYIDDISEYIKPGSVFFWLELYTRLYKEVNAEVIRRLQKSVIEFDDKQYLDYINRPKLMIRPWKHQDDALDSWLNSGGRGIIEMATATGKTLVGLNAALTLYQRSLEKPVSDPGHGKMNVLVLAHSKAILNQWRREAIDKLGFVGNPDDFYYKSLAYKDFKFTFNTIQSVCRAPDYYSADLLIVDEVHHGAAAEFSKALSIRSKYRLGLSATVDGKEKLERLEESIGDKVYRLTVEQALKDNIIPNFTWNVHVTYLEDTEQKDFKDVTEQMMNTFNRVRATAGADTSDIFGYAMRVATLIDFISLFEKARYAGKLDRVPEYWRTLMALIQQRRRIIHKSVPKLERALEIAGVEGRSKKCILFTMDIETCDKIAKILEGCGVDTYVVHSKKKDIDNKDTINRFKKAGHGVLISAKMLDEGVDIPDAEIGINVSSSKTRLQLIQRLGRILRKKDGKVPVFYHLVALPHSEDYVEEEDAVRYVDDLSWIQGTAAQWDIKVNIYNDDSGIRELREKAEKSVAVVEKEERNGKQEMEGGIKISKIVAGMDKSVKKKLVELLKLEKEKISDERWKELLRKSIEEVDVAEKYAVKYNEMWWLLIAGNRETEEIIELINKKP